MDIFRRLSAYGIGSLCTTILPVFLIVLSTVTEHVEAVFTNCSDGANTQRPYGTIKSPFYPINYPNNAACKWHIQINSWEMATIRFTNFNLVEKKDCHGDFLSISPNNTNHCGNQLPPTYISRLGTATIIITFRSDKTLSDKGFALEYYIGNRSSSVCDPKEFHCTYGNCLPLSWKCNGQKDCPDASDESPLICHDPTTPKPLTTVPWQCPAHEILCESIVTRKPVCLSEARKCDGHRDCYDGKDEKDCHSICNHFYDEDHGTFASPNFPQNYDANLDCSWTLSVKKGAIIQLRFHTFNLEQGYDTDYVKVYDGDTEEHLIGNYYSYLKDIHVPPKVIDGTGNTLKIVFHTDASSNSQGFNATYQTRGECLSGQTKCSSTDHNCYDDSEKCDNLLHCMKGQDELGCNGCGKDQIPCLTSHKGCYSVGQRCDGKRNCQLGEDELNCDPLVCKADLGLFLCGDRRCMEEKYICDESNDCTDGSDEKNCYVSTKVITAAAVGSIVCGLLLVAALSCTCKLYQLHVRDRFPPSHMSPLREIEEELLRREAPPSYTATMASPHFDEAQRAFIEGIQAAVIARNESRSSGRQNGSRRQRGTFVRMLSRDRTSRSDSQVQIQPDENTAESQTEMRPPSPSELENEVDTMMPEEESNIVGNGPPPLRRISGERSPPTVSPSTVEASPETAVQQESASSSVSDTDSETNQEALHMMVRAAANIRRMRLAGGLQNVMQAQDHRAARARSRTGSQDDIANPTSAEPAPSGDSAPSSDDETEIVAAVGSSPHLNENTNNTSERTDIENHSLPTEPTQEAFKMSESSENPTPHPQEEPELASDSESLPQDGEAEVNTQSPEEAASCDDREAQRDSDTEERLSEASSILSLASAGSAAAEDEDAPLVEP